MSHATSLWLISNRRPYVLLAAITCNDRNDPDNTLKLKSDCALGYSQVRSINQTSKGKADKPTIKECQYLPQSLLQSWSPLDFFSSFNLRLTGLNWTWHLLWQNIFQILQCELDGRPPPKKYIPKHKKFCAMIQNTQTLYPVMQTVKLVVCVLYVHLINETSYQKIKAEAYRTIMTLQSSDGVVPCPRPCMASPLGWIRYPERKCLKRPGFSMALAKLWGSLFWRSSMYCMQVRTKRVENNQVSIFLIYLNLRRRNTFRKHWPLN